MLGRIKEAIAASEQLRELEPYIPLYAGNLADALWVDGQTDAAIALYNDNLTRPGAGAAQGLARIYASLGRYEDSAKLLPQLNRDRFPDELIRTAMEVLRSAPGKSASAAQMPRFGRLNFVYLHVGAPERVLDYYEEVERDPLDYVLLWHSSYAPVRKTERFKKIVRDAGFVEYWRAKGWPDQCRPVGADDFACS
jgi:tetratricopeptide (TPR) repeat protein